MSVLKNLNVFHLASLICIGAFALLKLADNLTIGLVILTGLLFAVAVLTSIHHAESMAEKFGPALGTLILAIAVTVIEVGLIVNMMASATSGGAEIARDTVFSAVIVVTNGITGFCFLLGGLRYKELGFRVEGTSSLLAVLATLVTISLVLPNFTVSTPASTYSNAQLIFVSIVSVILYATLVIAQTVTHKDYFAESDEQKEVIHTEKPSGMMTLLNAICLIISLMAVIGLAKTLSPSIESGLVAVGAPRSSLGIILALLVLLPEAGSALKAARANQLQTSLNLALGSGAASVALTIPVIAVYSIMTDQRVALGLDSKGMAFLALTFIVSGLTLGTGKTAALKGIVHLMILLSYVSLTFMP